MHASFPTAEDSCMKLKNLKIMISVWCTWYQVSLKIVLMSNFILLYSALISHGKVCRGSPITAVWENFLLNQQLKLHKKFMQVSQKAAAIRTNESR